jgi:hypothetical protein
MSTAPEPGRGNYFLSSTVPPGEAGAEVFTITPTLPTVTVLGRRAAAARRWAAAVNQANHFAPTQALRAEHGDMSPIVGGTF